MLWNVLLATAEHIQIDWVLLIAQLVLLGHTWLAAPQQAVTAVHSVTNAQQVWLIQ
jgi:hypothetical protein